jgi:Domain of unknown function (DUF4340)
MSREKLIIVGVVVLGVLGGLVYKQSKNDDSLGQPQASATVFPTISAADDVDKISVTNGDKAEIVLEKRPDPKGTAAPDGGAPASWVVTKPLAADANQQAVSDLVANLKDLKVESSVNLKLDDEVRKDKLLDDAHALHLVAWKGADKKIDEKFGKSGPLGQLVIVGDKPDAVWAAKGYSSYLYAKDLKDFRKKDIFHFDDANVTGVNITNSHGALAFTKGDGSGKWTGTAAGKAIPRFDEEKVKDMLRALKSLNAEDFGDGKSLADTGLDRPEATLTVHLKDDASTPELRVGNVATGSNRWAKRGDSDMIYTITTFASDWATSDAAKFQAAVDGGAPAPAAGGAAAATKKK